ncbi:hypothetical protein GF391_03320 [Candidatus Uhrbacteria bacterium]|nr:hypothetical protein [Candidatus Uhrbacteria bacterium]
MTHLYNRLLTAITLLVMLTLSFVAVATSASANTGPWQWTDISENLGARENRPVWASAYAHPYWYLTDGQELYTGGHVWKTDGAIMEDITVEVRNAGLNRVDDIVTDGQTVIYLKSINTGQRNFEALSYTDGKWGYPAYTWANYLDSDEGIASIEGKNGTWIIISNNGKVFKWNTGSKSMKRLYFPDGTTDYRGAIIKPTYSFTHTSPANGLDSFEVKAVPASNGWLFAVSNKYHGSVDLLRYQNDTFTNINNMMPNKVAYISAMASNGSKVFLAGHSSSDMNRIYTYDGYGFNEYTKSNSALVNSWQNTMISYNGKSWMILQGKKLYRFSEHNSGNSNFGIERYGETRDYFVTISGNGNGTFMVGGAVSTMGNTNPDSPLMAKLVRVDENTSYNTPSNPVVTTNNEVWASMSVSHNKHELYHGQSSQVNITGGSPNGVDRIEIWLNGDVVKTCYDNDCDYTIYGNSYTKGSSLAFNGRVVDEQGHESWTWLGEYYVPVDNYHNDNNYYNDNDRLSVWFDFSPSGNQMYGDDYKSIQAHANADDGLEKLEIYVNDSLKRSCSFNRAYGDQKCYYTVYNDRYTGYDKIRAHVKAYDNYGRQVQTNTKYIYRDGYWDDNYNNNGTLVSTWFDGSVDKTDLGHNESRAITFYGNANRGLDRLELYANGNSVGSCYYNDAYGDKSCSKTIYGGNYNAGQSVTLRVKATDRYGYQNQSGSISFNIEDNDSNNNNSGDNVYTWMWLDPSDTNLDQNESTTINVGAAADDGLQKIEIYADGALKRTCNFSRAYGNRECSVDIHGNNFTPNRNINIYARATDYYGRADQTESQSIYVTDTSNNNQNDVNGNLTVTSNHDSGYNNYNQITFTANGWDDNGIAKIEILVNAQVVKTCNNSNSCSYTGGPYTTETVSYGANLYDDLGNRTWTGYKTIYKK